MFTCIIISFVLSCYRKQYGMFLLYNRGFQLASPSKVEVPTKQIYPHLEVTK